MLQQPFCRVNRRPRLAGTSGHNVEAVVLVCCPCGNGLLLVVSELYWLRFCGPSTGFASINYPQNLFPCRLLIAIYFDVRVRVVPKGIELASLIGNTCLLWNYPAFHHPNLFIIVLVPVDTGVGRSEECNHIAIEIFQNTKFVVVHTHRIGHRDFDVQCTISNQGDKEFQPVIIQLLHRHGEIPGKSGADNLLPLLIAEVDCLNILLTELRASHQLDFSAFSGHCHNPINNRCQYAGREEPDAALVQLCLLQSWNQKGLCDVLLSAANVAQFNI